jgi:pyridoxal phosphate enzyme (YggS family)
MDTSKSLAADIRNNLSQVHERIEKACNLVGREAKQVKLIVVSKAKSIAVIEAAIKVGIRNFGENYPEQAEEKIISLDTVPDLKWHMIGHLQSRKSIIVAQHFDYFHSLDSLKLAKKLDRILKEMKKTLPVLLEFNVANEISKYGWNAQDESHWPDLISEISSIVELPSLQVRGLMCMPPISEDIEESRQYFVKLAKLRDYLAKQFPGQRWDELSMGTSFDFEIAIEEGATFVRIGQAILGPRP